MDLTLIRTPTIKRVTFGSIFDEYGGWICFTLEDVIRERRGVPVSEWKIPGETAIPEGRYRLTLEYSPRFGRRVLTIHDVPGYVGIRMHAGNRHAETEGCPIPGMKKLVDPTGPGGGEVLASRIATEKLETIVTNAEGVDDPVWLTIVNPWSYD